MKGRYRTLCSRFKAILAHCLRSEARRRKDYAPCDCKHRKLDSARDEAILGVGRLTFLGFLFRVDEPAPITAATCRDQALKVDKKENPTLEITSTSVIHSENGLPVSVVSYKTKVRSGKVWYMVRGFVASGDVCGDLEFYGNTVVNADDSDLKKIFETYYLKSTYVPQFKDVFTYAEILYKHSMYKAAAPIFEQALSMLPDDNSQETMRRVTDQAGMAYGISGDIAIARAIFNAAIAKDPEYPMYYYNLACADAEENNLAQARVHLQQAFDRKQNVLAGETSTRSCKRRLLPPSP